MKKPIFLAILFVLLATPSAPIRAQVIDTPATSAQVEELKNTLISLLTQLIAQLQAQITEILAQQATQATQLGAVSAKVDSVVTQTAPVIVATPVAPIISVGQAYCAGVDISLPIAVAGSWSKGEGRIFIDGVSGPGFSLNSQGNTSNFKWDFVDKDASYLNKSFTYKVSVGGAEVSGPIVIPSCQ